MLSVAAALLVAPTPGQDLSGLWSPAPAAAASSSPGPASSSSFQPAASFDALEYPVRFYQRIFNADEPLHTWGPTATDGYTWFGEVTAGRRSEDLDLSFAVEGQHDPAGYQFCETPSTCDDVNVRVTSAGLLYLHKQQRTDFQQGYFADFPTRTVELSAADADSPLKVYREVLVGPPTSATGCEDYGENNPDTFACLFLREVIPDGIGGGSNEAALRAGLPGLVQPAASYSLLLAEEFDGTPPAANAAGCRDGLSTLDNEIWNYKNACHSDFVDSRGEPCGTVVDGHLVIGLAGNCNASVASRGKLHAKYGYFEIKFTVNMDHWTWSYHNYNFILFSRGEKLRYLLNRYGVEIEDWEDFLTNLDVEIDLFEMDVGSRSFVGHQFGNYRYRIADPDVPPTWSSKWYTLCGKTQWASIIDNPNRPCESSDIFTVTLGTEWTPSGYRTFVRVHEFMDDMIVVPKDRIDVNVRPVSGNSPGRTRRLSGAAKDAYFEYIDPDDPDTLLEKVVVSHVPLPLNVGAWGYLNSEDHPYIKTRMKIDYIRVWQPDNHYSDMEPAYQ